MICFKELVPNPSFDPTKPIEIGNQERKWNYCASNRPLQVGDVVHFTCNGRGRGGHFNVTARVTKVNKKTFKATELPRSYSPGTLWNVSISEETAARFGNIYINLSYN